MRHLAALLLALAAAAPARPAESEPRRPGAQAATLSRIVALRARPDADASVIEVEGDRPLSFTTLKLSGPPRVVIDVADATLAGVAPELSVEDGTVRRVAAALAGSRTARVVIELAGEAEFDVRAEGNRLDVRVPRLRALPEAVASATPPAEAEPAPEPVAKVEPPRARRLARVDAPGEASASAIEGAPFAGASSSASVSRLDASGQASSAAVEDRPVRAAGSATLDRVEPTGAASTAAAEPGPQGHASSSAERPMPTAPSMAARLEAEARPKLPTVSLVGPARRTSPPPSETPKQAPRPARRVASVHGQKSAIHGIGFRPSAGGVVIVRSDKPLEYTVASAEREVVVHLPGASIPLPNNRRPIDTSVFGGAVVRVHPRTVPGGVDLHVQLRGRAEFHVEQSGAVLTVTFAPPG